MAELRIKLRNHSMLLARSLRCAGYAVSFGRYLEGRAESNDFAATYVRAVPILTSVPLWF